MQFFPDPQTFIAIGSLSIKWYAATITGIAGSPSIVKVSRP